VDPIEAGNMQTVFSHIVQTRFSLENEDVATEALAFILRSSDAARRGLMKLLRGLVPDLPELRFVTQQAQGSTRPDMWGLDGAEPRVFIENKFWAGLTDNQPCAYLDLLAAGSGKTTVLLMVGPDAREHTLWREVTRRIADAGMGTTAVQPAAGIPQCVRTSVGPLMGLTSWTKLLSVLELETAEDAAARSDLLQLRALCEAADVDAFLPVVAEQVTDQRLPAFILQLGNLIAASVDKAVNEGVATVDRLQISSSWEGFGRYFRVVDGVEPWLCVHFSLWKVHGQTPLWLLISPASLSRNTRLRSDIEHWAAGEGVFTTFRNGNLAVAVTISTGEDKDGAVRSVVDQIKTIAAVVTGQTATPVGQ
jgi:hypothetical protein